MRSVDENEHVVTREHLLPALLFSFFFFFSSRRRHTRLTCDWSSDVCSSDLFAPHRGALAKSPGGLPFFSLPRRFSSGMPLICRDPLRLPAPGEIGRASCRERV